MPKTVTDTPLAVACRTYLRLLEIIPGLHANLETYRCDPTYRAGSFIKIYASDEDKAASLRDALRDQLTDRASTRTTEVRRTITRWTGTTVEGAEVTIYATSDGPSAVTEDLGEW